jgi:hypothetical protein
VTALASPTVGTPFVGRGDELRAIVGAVADARRGRGRVLLVAGEAGIGKTRLIEEAVGELDVAVHWGRCREAAGAPAYWPWTQALRGLAETLPPDELRAPLDADARLLARLVPPLRALLPAAPDATSDPRFAGDPEQLRFQLFDALAGWLRRVTRARPAVLVLDDLHWADSESLLLLRFLAAEIATLPLAVIGTHREIEARQLPTAPRLLADAARLGQRVVLRGLDPDDVAALVRGVLGDVRPDVLRAIERTSEGNPFFVRELVALVARDGQPEGATLALPDEVRELVRRRLEPLPAEVRELLGVAAVLGREFDLPLVVAVVGVDAPTALDRLAEAVRAGLVQEVPGAPERHRFAHALVHDTVYDGLPVAIRAALHVRAAAVLEGLHPAERDARAADVALHLLRSEDRLHVERSIAYSVRAAELAHAALGYEEASGHYERALEAQLATGRPLAERLPLLLRFGETQIGAADVEGFRTTFLEAARLARELGDAEALAQAALGFATLRHYAGSDTAKIGLLEEALDALPDGDSVLRARVLGRLASASYYAYPARERDRLSRSAVEVARRLGDREALSRILLERYHVLIGPDDAEERVAASLETARLAEESGASGLACEAHLQAYADLVILGDVARAELELAAAERAAAEQRFGHHRWRMLLARGQRTFISGDTERAEALAHEALGVSRVAVANDAALVHAGQMFNVRRAQGRLDELRALTEGAVARYPATPIWRNALLLIRAEGGDLDGARALLDEIAAHDFADLPRDWGWLASLAGIADASALLGDRRRAAVLYELLQPYAALEIASVYTYWGSVARTLGVLALARDDVPAAIAHFEDALARAVRLGAVLESVRASEGLARALLARDADGDRVRAASVVDEALGRARRHGFTSLVVRLDALAATLEAPGAAPAPASSAAPAPPAAPVATSGVGAPPATALAEDASTSAPVTPARRRDTDAPSAPRVARLVREGSSWCLTCGEESMPLKETKGVGYLRTLLASPGAAIPAVVLEGAGRATSDVASAGRDAPRATPSELRARLADLRAELDEAESWGDLGRSERLREQIEDLAHALTSGARGDARTRAGARDGDAAERARLNVTRALHATLRKIESACPRLGRHLAASIRTGTVCAYEPEPAHALRWELPDGD